MEETGAEVGRGKRIEPPSAIKSHLMEDEQVIDYCVTDDWTWVCTDRRLIKTKVQDDAVKELHDLSFEEISSISLVNKGKDGSLLIVGGVLIFTGALLLASNNFVILLLSVILSVLGGISIYLWWISESSYFEFRGDGLLQEENDRWQIEKTGARSSDRVREFTKTVRSQL